MEITCPMCRYVLEGDGETAFILDIEWDRPSPDSPILPNLVGPFGSRIEAHEWAALNISNGSWECRPLSYPYLRTSPAGGAS